MIACYRYHAFDNINYRNHVIDNGHDIASFRGAHIHVHECFTACVRAVYSGFFACVHHGGGCWVLPCLTSCDILDTTRRRRAAARRRGIKARLVYGVACLLSSLFGWCPTEQIIPPLISYRNLHYWIFNTGAGNGKTCADPCQKIFLQELEYEGDK